MQWKVIFHGYFAVRLDSPPTGDEPALLLEGFLHVSNIPTNKVCCLTDFATAPSGQSGSRIGSSDVGKGGCEDLSDIIC